MTYETIHSSMLTAFAPIIQGEFKKPHTVCDYIALCFDTRTDNILVPGMNINIRFMIFLEPDNFVY